MKHLVPTLRRGDSVTAVVREIWADGSCLVSLSGDLVRVQNETNQKFEMGQKVRLEVVGTDPLRLRMLYSFRHLKWNA